MEELKYPDSFSPEELLWAAAVGQYVMDFMTDPKESGGFNFYVIGINMGDTKNLHHLGMMTQIAINTGVLDDKLRKNTVISSAVYKKMSAEKRRFVFESLNKAADYLDEYSPPAMQHRQAIGKIISMLPITGTITLDMKGKVSFDYGK